MGDEGKGEVERVVAFGDGDGNFASADLVHADSGFDEHIAEVVPTRERTEDGSHVVAVSAVKTKMEVRAGCLGA